MITGLGAWKWKNGGTLFLLLSKVFTDVIKQYKIIMIELIVHIQGDVKSI